MKYFQNNLKNIVSYNFNILIRINALKHLRSVKKLFGRQVKYDEAPSSGCHLNVRKIMCFFDFLGREVLTFEGF